MSTRLGLISDVHATPAPVEQALSIFAQQGVDHILCAGDIAGYGNELEPTVELLVNANCQAILGNHEQWYLERTDERPEDQAHAFFAQLPSILEYTLDGKRLYMVHASPPQSVRDGIRLLDEDGDVIEDRKRYWSERLADFDPDILIVGHTHQLFAEQLGNTLVINPGSTCFNHSCVILNLPEMDVEVFALSNKELVKAWNWGGQVRL